MQQRHPKHKFHDHTSSHPQVDWIITQRGHRYLSRSTVVRCALKVLLCRLRGGLFLLRLQRVRFLRCFCSGCGSPLGGNKWRW